MASLNSSMEVTPALTESGSNLSVEGVRLPSGGSHDTSSTGSHDIHAVERMNPFEVNLPQSQQQPPAVTAAPLDTLGVALPMTASPDRAASSSTPSSPTPRSPSTGGATNTVSVPRNLPPAPLVQQLQPQPQAPPPDTSAPPQQQQQPYAHNNSNNNYAEENDDFTHSSSAVNSTEPPSSDGYTPSTEDSVAAGTGVAGTVVRFLENTRRRISTNNNGARGESDEFLLENEASGVIIGGFLQKLGRNGKWQMRWFESDGECLSYYKNESRTKLLATLDLEKVGEIGLDPADDSECAFTIQVLGRLYHLRGENKVSCSDWVITLNRIKEAHMQQGNVKLGYLGQQPSQQPVDFLDQADDMMAPRVVVVSNRQRTRAVAETQDFDQIMRVQNEQTPLDSAGTSNRRLSTIGTVVLGRWSKRRSSISRLRSKLTKWALSLRGMSCTSDSAVGLDNHVHPPGHDDDRKKKSPGLQSWIGKETTKATPSAATPEDDDAGARMRTRKMSSASEDIRVLS